MKEKPDKKGKKILLLPLFGIITFILLYIVATLFYPGGSQADRNSAGFSWKHNYWCTLLNKKAINGQCNSARPIALSAMFILCTALAFFWYIFPKHMNFGKYGRITIQLSGTIAMIIAFFLFTDGHDIVINFASFFALIALMGTFAGLYKVRWRGLFWFGIFNILMGILNNYLYYHKELMIYLPVIQKISFASFLFWFCLININLYRSKGIYKVDQNKF